MTNELRKYICNYCGIQLVDIDGNGKLQFGKHEHGCPATRAPEKEGPARKTAKAKLICEDCPNQNSDIIDVGNDLAYCSVCPHAGLVKSAVAADINKRGKHGPVVEIIHPAPRKTIGHWKHLYFDLLQKHVIALAKLGQYESRK